MSVERADIVVVGGGIAGLAAAWALGDRQVLVLEAADRIGGRVRSDRHDGVPYHLGAQYLAGAASALVLDELAVDRVELPKGGGLFLGGRLGKGTTTSLMRGLRTGVGGLADIAWVQREAERASGLVRGLMDPGAGGGLAPEAIDLDKRSFDEAIGGRRAEVRSFYGTLIRSLACKSPADLSALYAFAMLGSEGESGLGAASRARGGMNEVLEAFGRALTGRVRTGIRVEAIHPSNGQVEIVYRHGAGKGRLLAQACVVAVPAPEVLRVVPSLHPGRRSALQRVRYGRFLSVALFLREPVWVHDTWAISCDLPIVSTLLNPAVLTGSGAATVLSSYASEDGAAQMWGLPDDEIVRRFVAEISGVFPRLAEVVYGADVRRWDPGYPAWEPGHLALLPELAAPSGPIAFCGDYLSIPSIDGAIVSALRAAEAVRGR